MELGIEVVGKVSGSVPVATMAVSPVATSAVEVGSWLTSVVGLGLMVPMEEPVVRAVALMFELEENLLCPASASPSLTRSCLLTQRT